MIWEPNPPITKDESKRFHNFFTTAMFGSQVPTDNVGETEVWQYLLYDDLSHFAGFPKQYFRFIEMMDHPQQMDAIALIFRVPRSLWESKQHFEEWPPQLAGPMVGKGDKCKEYLEQWKNGSIIGYDIRNANGNSFTYSVSDYKKNFSAEEWQKKENKEYFYKQKKFAIHSSYHYYEWIEKPFGVYAGVDDYKTNAPLPTKVCSLNWKFCFVFSCELEILFCVSYFFEL